MIVDKLIVLPLLNIWLNDRRQVDRVTFTEQLVG